jgi:hypothetical protein
MALHTQKVRRALTLQDTSLEIQDKVSSGQFSERAALEFHRLPPMIQAAMEEEVGPHTTAQAIRLRRKRQERKIVKEKAARGEDFTRRRRGHDGMAGKPFQRGAIAWRTATEQKLQIGQLSNSLSDLKYGSHEYHEVRGALGAALWCRGDLDDPLLPSIHVDKMDDPVAEKKLNEIFNQIVANEAARHEKRARAT